jgi:hypothetical protein
MTRRSKDVIGRILKGVFAISMLWAGCCANAQTQSATGIDQKDAAQKDVTEVVINGEQNVSRWFRAESQHFIIYSDTKRDDVSVLLNKLERFDYLLRLYTKADSKTEAAAKLTLYYQARSRDLKQIDNDQPAYAIGLYTSCEQSVQGFGAHMYYRENSNKALEKQPENEGLAYIFEAYARHFLYRYTDLRIPTWYIDGFAQYFAGTRFSETETILGMAPENIGEYLNFIGNGHAYSLDYKDILLQNDSKGHNDAGIAGLKLEFQAKSWMLTHYILSSTENIQHFRTYIGLIMEDVEQTKAFEQAFGYKVSKLRNELWKYKRKSQALKLNLVAGGASDIRFSSLPLSANNLILADAALKSCPDTKQGASLLKNIMAEAQKFPHSDYAQFVLSRAQIAWGNPQDAIAFLSTKTKDNNFEAFYLLGSAQLRLAKQSQNDAQKAYLDSAKSNLLRACAINPQSAEAMYAYFKAGVVAQSTPNDEVLGSTVLAWQLQPEVGSYVRSTALVFAYLKKIPETEHALSLLAHNSRDPQMAEWAKTWQTKLNTGVTRTELLAEMRVDALPNTRFKEWTIASEQVMQAVELAAGLKAAEGFLQDQQKQNSQMPEPGGFGNQP